MNKSNNDITVSNYNVNPKYSEQNSNKETKPENYIIHEKKPQQFHGEIIGKIAESFYYVFEDTKINELSKILTASDDINVVAVLSKNEKIIGIVTKKNLTAMLSKSFGRELFGNNEIITVTEQVHSFNFNRNIFSVADEITSSKGPKETSYYILYTDENHFAGIISNNRLLMYLSEMTQKDIALAKQLQSFVVKDEMEVETSTFSFLAASQMAKGVGGDYYIIKKYSEKKYLITLCDVSGKGMAASLLSVLLDGMLNIYDMKQGIPDFIIFLNNYVLNTFNLEKFITGVFIDFDEEKLTASIYDMGHSHIYIMRNNRFSKINIKSRNFPIGISKEYTPRANLLKLQQSDILILLSDGIEEQTNATGEEFGLSRVADLVISMQRHTLKNIKNRIFDEIVKFRLNQTQLDDNTLIFVKINS